MVDQFPGESMIRRFADVYSIGSADRLAFLSWQTDAGREEEEETRSTSSQPLSRPLADRQRGERERRIVAVSRAIRNPKTQAAYSSATAGQTGQVWRAAFTTSW
jgi:hypothetical protein